MSVFDLQPSKNCSVSGKNSIFNSIFSSLQFPSDIFPTLVNVLLSILYPKQFNSVSLWVQHATFFLVIELIFVTKSCPP